MRCAHFVSMCGHMDELLTHCFHVIYISVGAGQAWPLFMNNGTVCLRCSREARGRARAVALPVGDGEEFDLRWRG